VSLDTVRSAALRAIKPRSRLLVTYMPGGIDRFFAEAGEPAHSPGLPPAPEGPPDLERLTSIAARYGMDIQQPG
jgi:hypothetical protein